MKSFVGVTGSKLDKACIECLKEAKWDVNNAVDIYFSKGIGETAKVVKSTSNTTKIKALFEKYKEASTG